MQTIIRVLVLELPRAGTDARSLDRTALLLCPAPFAASASWSLRKRLPRTEMDPYLSCGCLFVERKHHYGLLVRSNLHVAIATRTQSIIGAHIDDSLLVRFTPLNAYLVHARKPNPHLHARLHVSPRQRRQSPLVHHTTAHLGQTRATDPQVARSRASPGAVSRPAQHPNPSSAPRCRGASRPITNSPRLPVRGMQHACTHMDLVGEPRPQRCRAGKPCLAGAEIHSRRRSGSSYHGRHRPRSSIMLLLPSMILCPKTVFLYVLCK